jgi:hypothetical protein
MVRNYKPWSWRLCSKRWSEAEFPSTLPAWIDVHLLEDQLISDAICCLNNKQQILVQWILLSAAKASQLQHTR